MLGCDSSRTQCTRYLVVVRDHNWFAGYFFKGRPDCAVKGCAALEANIVTNLTPPDHAVEIIGHNRIAQAGYQVTCLRPLLLVAKQV